MATLEEVARSAGVSIATASRAFSRPDMVKDSSLTAVMSAAARLKYVPNSTARALATGATGLLGMIIPGLSSPYFSALLAAANDEANRGDRAVLVADSAGEAPQELQLIGRLRGRVDGLVLVSPRSAESELIEALSGFPAVTVNRELDAVDAVSMDIARGMHQLTRHVLACGCRRLGYIGGPPGSTTDAARFGAVQDVAIPAGAEATYLAQVQPNVSAGAALAPLIATSAVDAVISYSALAALGLSLAAGDPALLIAAGDDFVDPGLGDDSVTSLHQPTDELGRVAVRLLLGRLSSGRRGPTARQYVFPSLSVAAEPG